MFWFGIMHICSFLLDWFRVGQLLDQEKDLEILPLRQQLGLAERKLNGSSVERVNPRQVWAQKQVCSHAFYIRAN